MRQDMDDHPVARMQRSEIREPVSNGGRASGFHFMASGRLAVRSRWLRLAMLGLSALPVQSFAADFAAALQAEWLAPRSADFARFAAALAPAVKSACVSPAGLEPARAAWKHSLSAWETLAGVAVGPVLERRSQRAIDFTPTRPRLIEKAIKSAPKNTADMELIGTPAKGLPALEWLLWTRPVVPGTPACDYAVQVAEDIRREADALAGATFAAPDPQVALSDLVNQWVGGIERLRWPGMEMPVRVALTANPPTRPDFPRSDSGVPEVAWSAQWQALKHLAVTGQGSLAGALRERGQARVADALILAVNDADTAMQGLTSVDRERILVAAKRLAGLKHRVETEVAPALGVSIGFSDADGD
jgi:predicted lipoprotein